VHHYIALSWIPNHAPSAREAVRLGESLKRGATSWDVVLNSDGLTVYSGKPVDKAMRAYLLQEGGGVVFGRLFRSAAPDTPVDASELDANRIVRSKGQYLLEEYWGSYVAILHSREQKTVLVARDCSGRIPCYYIHVAGIHIFFSDIRDTEPFGFRFTLNPNYLASFILHHPLHIRDTGLREVSELLSGDCVSISCEGASQQCLWNPRLLACTRIIKDYGSAESALVSVTENVIRLWASLYDRILLMLSGGLDSAIVLGCLKRMGLTDRVICINRYTESTEDDERQYAKSAAKMAGVPLMEHSRISDASVFVKKARSAPPSASPSISHALRMLSLDATNELAKQFNCDTVWTGQGGDHVFLQFRNPFPAVDYLLQHRLPYLLPTILYESSILSRRSVWSILGQSLRYSLAAHAVPPEPFTDSGASLMNHSAVVEIPDGYTTGPWHTGTGRPAPGKQLQIDIFADLLNRHKPLPGLEYAYECHPLISQPLLELSLRIPTYHLLTGGRQRAMARLAFADRVPSCILSREDKGGIRDQVRELLRGSGDLLRETLLEGTLVSLGILDRSSVQRIIVAQDTYRPTEAFPLLACVAVEMWAAYWTQRTPGLNADARSYQ
jgi:asparagine synthase (glutamine-hydrolysing)